MNMSTETVCDICETVIPGGTVPMVMSITVYDRSGAITDQPEIDVCKKCCHKYRLLSKGGLVANEYFGKLGKMFTENSEEKPVK